MELGKGAVGPEVKWDIEFVGGKLVAKLAYDGADLDGDISVAFSAMQVVEAMIDKAEEVIPGDQKMFAEMLKQFVAGLVK
jgi:hypothetical protein